MIAYRVRRRLRHSILSAMGTNLATIPPSILSQWKRWGETKHAKPDVCIFGVTSFDYRIQRPQHLAMQLAKLGHRVFYVENEFIPAVAGVTGSLIQVQKRAENLFIVKFSCTHNLFIYDEVPTQKDIASLQASLVYLQNISRSQRMVLKVDHPFWNFMLKGISIPTVYDCLDDHSGFKENAPHISSEERKMFARANAVIVTSSLLLKKAKKAGAKRIVLIPNAGEYVMFSAQHMRKVLTAKAMRPISRPIVGYYGALAEWFDVDLVIECAKTYPTASFVCIGRNANPALTAAARSYANIHLLGEVAYADLPRYVYRFDVCIIPFRLTKLITSTNPVKFFEYAASGKPIVTTALPELQKYSADCFVARNKKTFVESVGKALKHPERRAKQRITIARANTWDVRGAALTKLIRELT